jgi:hypothetical protein
MKITLKNFKAEELSTKEGSIEGVHPCMSGAVYTYCSKTKTLTYEGGVSSLFVHSDFPVGDGLTPNEKTISLIREIEGFTITYSDLCNHYKETTFEYSIYKENDIESFIKFIRHLERIRPNSWECSQKQGIIEILKIFLINKLKR